MMCKLHVQCTCTIILPANAIINEATNISDRPVIQADITSRFFSNFINNNIIIVQVICITIETKEVARIVYNRFLFRIRTQVKSLVLRTSVFTCVLIHIFGSAKLPYPRHVLFKCLYQSMSLFGHTFVLWVIHIC
jgi:hypothetical protein